MQCLIRVAAAGVSAPSPFHHAPHRGRRSPASNATSQTATSSKSKTDGCARTKATTRALHEAYAEDWFTGKSSPNGTD
jgi:hypothetical protein